MLRVKQEVFLQSKAALGIFLCCAWHLVCVHSSPGLDGDFNSVNIGVIKLRVACGKIACMRFKRIGDGI